jgi:hypothetical protein
LIGQSYCNALLDQQFQLDFHMRKSNFANTNSIHQSLPAMPSSQKENKDVQFDNDYKKNQVEDNHASLEKKENLETWSLIGLATKGLKNVKNPFWSTSMAKVLNSYNDLKIDQDNGPTNL